ncbi:MAG: hypothetical protein Kow00117_03920 [Phototrophicales bacterium]
MSATERESYLDDLVAAGVQIVYYLEEINRVVIVPTGDSSTLSRVMSSANVMDMLEVDQTAYALDQWVNDPLYVEQWALAMVRAPLAWKQLPATVSPVYVAVIDSGVCLHHDDLQGRILAGWDYVDGDDNPQDMYDHGCGVAGIIAANQDDGFGLAGVAPNALILPYRVLDADGIGSYSDIANAILQAVSDGADIINLSLGGFRRSDFMEDAVNYAVSQGVIVVAAAGNTGQEGLLYPAAYDSVMAIGSVNSSGTRSLTSTYGTGLTAYAPGDQVLILSSNGNHRIDSGTSFASAFASGVLALSIGLDTTPQIGLDGIMRFNLSVMGCPGDVNLDGEISILDIDQMNLDKSTSYDPAFDMNNDQIIDISDVQHLFWYGCNP